METAYKIRMCIHFMNCRYGSSCNFAHSRDELRPTSDKVSTFRTKMCHSLPHCPRGDNCHFAHSRVELRPTIGNYDNFRTQMCRNPQNCPLGDQCAYAHDNRELRSFTAPLYSWRTSMCKRGDRCEHYDCWFAHNEDELRTHYENVAYETYLRTGVYEDFNGEADDSTNPGTGASSSNPTPSAGNIPRSSNTTPSAGNIPRSSNPTQSANPSPSRKFNWADVSDDESEDESEASGSKNSNSPRNTTGNAPAPETAENSLPTNSATGSQNEGTPDLTAPIPPKLLDIDSIQKEDMATASIYYLFTNIAEAQNLKNIGDISGATRLAFRSLMIYEVPTGADEETLMADIRKRKRKISALVHPDKHQLDPVMKHFANIAMQALLSFFDDCEKEISQNIFNLPLGRPLDERELKYWEHFNFKIMEQ